MNTLTYNGRKYLEGKFLEVDDVLVVEESLKITVNNTPFTVTMRTPGTENELVRGLLFTENVYSDLSSDPLMVVQENNSKGIITCIDVTIPSEKIGAGLAVARNIISASSCGVCGKEELDTSNTGALPLHFDGKLQSASVQLMFERMSEAQNTFKQSGGSHASAAFSLDATLLTIQEDIGRHNAVDKVIGSLLLQRKLNEAKCLVVSGRISYEIVNKCFVAGIPFLAAVSAPSSLAVDLSEQLGITLLGFCRGDKFTVYSRTDRIDN